MINNVVLLFSVISTDFCTQKISKLSAVAICFPRKECASTKQFG